MNRSNMSAVVGGLAGLLALAPITGVFAQTTLVSATAGSGDWTLIQREAWLKNRLEQSKADGSLAPPEYARVKGDLSGIASDEDAMRDHQKGQLTDNQTTALEARLDDVAGAIHWLHENSFQRPW